jgi:hypothetical protein
MEHFEDELKIALTRLKRTELKAILQQHDDTSFEAETADAFKSLEKKRLKALLVEYNTFKSEKQKVGIIPEGQVVANNPETQFVANNPETTKISFLGYWKYAAAACVVFGLSFYFIFTNNNGTSDEVALNKPKTNIPPIESKVETSKVKKTIETKNQILESKIFVEEIGQLGFASNKPFDLKVFVNAEAKGLKYKLHQNIFEIKTNKKIEVKIFYLQEQYYFKVNQKVYLLLENFDFETPRQVIEEEILDLLP